MGQNQNSVVVLWIPVKFWWCSAPIVSLRLAVLNAFRGFFGPKMAVLGPELQFLKLRSATCESRSWPPPLSFLLKLCVIVLHTHRYHRAA